MNIDYKSTNVQFEIRYHTAVHLVVDKMHDGEYTNDRFQNSINGKYIICTLYFPGAESDRSDLNFATERSTTRIYIQYVNKYRYNIKTRDFGNRMWMMWAGKQGTRHFTMCNWEVISISRKQ